MPRRAALGIRSAGDAGTPMSLFSWFGRNSSVAVEWDERHAKNETLVVDYDRPGSGIDYHRQQSCCLGQGRNVTAGDVVRMVLAVLVLALILTRWWLRRATGRSLP